MPPIPGGACQRADVIVIGGGITGLTAALRIVQQHPTTRVVMLEAAPSVGGKIRTVRRDGFVVDLGADVFLARRPEAERLCREVGLSQALRPVPSAARIQRRGALYPLPEGWTGLVPGRLGPLLTSPLLSVADRLRAMAEPFVPARSTNGDESLEAFVVRRFGRGVYTNLVEPLVGGLYGSDAPVSLAATLPHLHTMEAQGGILRSWRAQTKQDGPPFKALEGGMDQWPTALAEALVATRRVSIHTDTPVSGIEPIASGYRVHAAHCVIEAAAVIVTTSSQVAASLLSPLDPAFADPLRAIPQGSMETVAVGYPPDQATRPIPSCTGYLIPRREGGSVQAVTVYSRKHPGSAPQDHLLFRVFVRPDPAAGEDPSPVARACLHLERQLGLRGAPIFTATHTWHRALPRYTLGHLDRVAALDAACTRHPGLYLAGACYHGAGLPACVADGERAALAAATHLNRALRTPHEPAQR